MPKRVPRIFVSYRRAEEGPVRELIARLNQDHFECWVDTVNMPGAPGWQQHIHDALYASDICLAMISQGGPQKFQLLEIEWANIRRVEDPDRAFRVIPIVLPGASVADVPSILSGINCIIFEKSLDEVPYGRLLDYINEGFTPALDPAEWFVSEARHVPRFVYAVRNLRAIVAGNIRRAFKVEPDLAVTLYARSFPDMSGVGQFEYDLVHYFNLRDPTPMFGPIVKNDQRTEIARAHRPMSSGPVPASPSATGFVGREGIRFAAWFKIGKGLWGGPASPGGTPAKQGVDGLLFINARNEDLHDAQNSIFDPVFYVALNHLADLIGEIITDRLQKHRWRIASIQDLASESLFTKRIAVLAGDEQGRNLPETVRRDLSALFETVVQDSGGAELAINVYLWDGKSQCLYWIFSNGPSSSSTIVRINPADPCPVATAAVASDPNNKPLLLHRLQQTTAAQKRVLRTHLGNRADVALVVPVLSADGKELLGVVEIQKTESDEDFDTDSIQVLYEMSRRFIGPLMSTLRDVTSATGRDALPLRSAVPYRPFPVQAPDFDVADLLRLNFSPMKYLLHWNRIEPLVSPEERPLPCPSMIEIWPSMVCNQACEWCRCSQSHGRSAGQNPMMSSAGLMRLARELVEDPAFASTDLLISGGGEPLLHPDLAEFIRVVVGIKGTIGVFTNGTKSGLDARARSRYGLQESPDPFLFWERFLGREGGHSFARISFNGDDPDSYEVNHGAGPSSRDQYSEAKKTILDIMGLRRGRASIAVGSTVTREFAHTIEAQIRHARALGVDFIQIRPELGESLGGDDSWRSIQAQVVTQELACAGERAFGVKYTDTERGYQDHDYEECLAAYLVPTLMPGTDGRIRVNPCSYALNQFRRQVPTWGWYEAGSSFRAFWGALGRSVGRSDPSSDSAGFKGEITGRPVNPRLACPQCRYRMLNKRLLAIRDRPSSIGLISQLVNHLEHGLDVPPSLMEELANIFPDRVIVDFESARDVFRLRRKLGFRPSL